jgi:hypothetical protein
MATKLDKDITRESKVKFDDREIMVTLTEDQKISFKLKGLKSGKLDISIEELYHMLNGSEPNEEKPKKGSINVQSKPKKGKNNPMISLHDLRTYNAISALDYPTIVKFEAIIKNLMDNYPEKYGKYRKP